MPHRSLEIVPKDDKVFYKLHFRSLTDLYSYLNSNPEVNNKAFPTQKSLTMQESFAGEPLDKAIEYLIGGYTKSYTEFMKMKKILDTGRRMKTAGRRSENAMVGSRPNVPGYVAGVPKTMKRLEKTTEKKFISVYMNLAYPGDTTDMQIINRGILAINLVNLLEENDIGVDFKVFEAVRTNNEIFKVEIELKKPGSILDVRKCYYPLCGKEFLRRIMVRLKESVPFKNNWGRGYGSLIPSYEIRELFDIGKNQIMILSPEEMHIKGKDIYEDAENFIDVLNLDKNVKIPWRKAEVTDG